MLILVEYLREVTLYIDWFHHVYYVMSLCSQTLWLYYTRKCIKFCSLPAFSLSADPGEIVLGAWYLSCSVAILGQHLWHPGSYLSLGHPPPLFADSLSVSGLAASLLQSTHGKRARPSLTTQSGHRLSENSWAEKIPGKANSRASLSLAQCHTRPLCLCILFLEPSLCLQRISSLQN